MKFRHAFPLACGFVATALFALLILRTPAGHLELRDQRGGLFTSWARLESAACRTTLYTSWFRFDCGERSDDADDTSTVSVDFTAHISARTNKHNRYIALMDGGLLNNQRLHISQSYLSVGSTSVSGQQTSLKTEASEAVASDLIQANRFGDRHNNGYLTRARVDTVGGFPSILGWWEQLTPDLNDTISTRLEAVTQPSHYDSRDDAYIPAVTITKHGRDRNWSQARGWPEPKPSQDVKVQDD